MSKDKKTEEVVVLKQAAVAASEAILHGKDETIIEPMEDGRIKKTRIVNGEKIVMILEDGATPYDPSKPQGRDLH